MHKYQNVPCGLGFEVNHSNFSAEVSKHVRLIMDFTINKLFWPEYKKLNKFFMKKYKKLN